MDGGGYFQFLRILFWINFTIVFYLHYCFLKGLKNLVLSICFYNNKKCNNNIIYFDKYKKNAYEPLFESSVVNLEVFQL